MTPSWTHTHRSWPTRRRPRVGGAPPSADHIPKGRSRLRRRLRQVTRSPLLRVVIAIALGMRVRAISLGLAEQRKAWGTSRRVAIATRPLAVGDALRADDLRWVRLPMAAVPPGTNDRVIGRRLTAPVSVGEIIGPARVAAAGASRLRAKTGVGRVALPVSVGDLSPIVVEGDEVDVLDSMGNEVASAAEVLQVRERQITISVERAQLARLGVALVGPVVVVLRGPDSGPDPGLDRH